MAKSMILIIDDEPGIRTSLSEVLAEEGYEVVALQSAEEALEFIERQMPDFILLDIWLPGIDGIELLRQIHGRCEGVPVVMISGHGTIDTAVQATKLGAYDYLEKPLSLSKLLVVIRNALHQSEITRELAHLRAQQARRFRIIGHSAAMEALREMVYRAGPSNGRVLITGESGTGKELIARAVHVSSRRAMQSFVEINCAAIPEELIESELFGHEKGAFTGAVNRKRGKFEIADGGAILLDEIGDMSLRTQSKVLRVLEEQRVERLGGSATIDIDVRVIAATNRDLSAMIQENAFREDLYYRLNVIPILAPPLRSHLEDLPDLAQHFLELLGEELGQRPLSISKAALQKLAQHSWPGNVRELKNVLERAVILARHDRLEPEDITLIGLPGATELRGEEDASFSLKDARLQFERDFILRTLKANDWNITRTAEVLQLERSHLHRKIKLFRLNIPDSQGRA